MKLVTSTYALTLLGAAFADCGVDGGTILLDDPKKLDELETCDTIFGNIQIDKGYAYFALDGPQEITGTVIAHQNYLLKELALDTAHKLGGLSIINPSIAGPIFLPEVTEIGNLEWKDITWHSGVNWFRWEAGNLTTVSNLTVEGTWLSSFLPDGFGDSWSSTGLVSLETADSVRVADNVRMDYVVIPSLKTISGPLVVTNNVKNKPPGVRRPEDSMLVSFPALESAGSVAIYDTIAFRGTEKGKIDLPALGRVFGDFNVTGIGGMTEVSVPALTDIDGGLNIVENPGLETIEFPELRSVRHIILGASYGAFKEISFPALEKVGLVRVDSSRQTRVCSSLGHLREIASEFYCEDADGTYEPDKPSSTSEGSTPIPTHTGILTHTDEPSQTDDAAISAETSTGGPKETDSAGSTPTGDHAAGPSESEPATSDASSLKRSPFRIVSLWFQR